MRESNDSKKIIPNKDIGRSRENSYEKVANDSQSSINMGQSASDYKRVAKKNNNSSNLRNHGDL